MRFLVILALAALFVPTETVAQDRAPSQSRKRVSLLFENALTYRFGDPLARDKASPARIAWELGLLANAKSLSFGGTIFAAVNLEDETRWGIRPRLRILLDPEMTLDIGPGIILGGSSYSRSLVAPGFNGVAALGLGRAVGLILQIEHVTVTETTAGPTGLVSQTTRHWSPYAGLRFEGKTGLWALFGELAALALFAATF